MDKVSIIVPCYNQAQYLSDALDSVLAQTYPEWECIVVNDGSPDNVDDVIKPYLERDTRIKYLKQENQGVSVARNNGIRNTGGEYILPLDADDKLAPSFVEKAVSYIKCHDKCKLVYCNTELFGEQQGLFKLRKYEFEQFIWSNCIPCTALFRRQDFNATQGYNPNMKEGLEDWDFWLSLLRPQDEVHCIEESLFFYRMKDCMESRNKQWGKCSKAIWERICLNHISVYEPYVKDLIWLHDRLENAINYNEMIMHSKSYKIACLISKAYHFITFPFIARSKSQ